MPELVLRGCTPVPLAAYLKGIGVLRLLAEQMEKDILGFWRDEALVLKTAVTEDAINHFFLKRYRPSPIISPWSGRAGFLEGEAGEESTRAGAAILRQVQKSTAKKFEPLRLVIKEIQAIPSLNLLNSVRSLRKEEEKRHERIRKAGGSISDQDKEKLGRLKIQETELKGSLIRELRNQVPDNLVDWIDACLRVGVSAGTAPLLGSGGNDGSRDLGVNYAQKLSEIFDYFDEEGSAKSFADSALKSALYGTPTSDLIQDAMGQFAPGQGGPNCGNGFHAVRPLNPWNTVLALEGAILFAGSATRRLGRMEKDGAASFPFSVATTGTHGAATIPQDEMESRGEIWMPIWNRAASYIELRALLSEGRATIGRLPTRDGLDFIRAISTLGINRGVASFQRYALVKREGRNYMAAPMNRVRVRRNGEAERLLHDFDHVGWLTRIRNHVRSKGAAAGLKSIGRNLDAAIFEMAQETSPRAVQAVLAALGDVGTYLGLSAKARDPEDGNQAPPPRLSSAWFEAANDGSSEFRVAAALAGLGRGPGRDHEFEADQQDLRRNAYVDEIEVEQEAVHSAQESATDEATMEKILPPPFRAHLAPLDKTSWYGSRRKWADRNEDGLAVWGHGALDRNLIAVLERRLLFCSRRNVMGGPFGGRAPADLASVLAFLAGDTDDAKVAGLLQGLAWAEPPNALHTKGARTGPMPLAYALMKPLFAPIDQLHELPILRDRAELSIPSGLMQRLRSEDVGAAIIIASRRAQASGWPVIGVGLEGKRIRPVSGSRLLASLLIPLRTADVKYVLKRAYPALFDEKDPAQTEESPADAA